MSITLSLQNHITGYVELCSSSPCFELDFVPLTIFYACILFNYALRYQPETRLFDLPCSFLQF